MSDTPRIDRVKSVMERGSDVAPAPREPIVLKNEIAVLDPKPIAKGAFGLIYLGRVLNPIGLLAERILWGEENPRWLGLDLPYEEPDRSGHEAPARLPRPITDPAVQARVYDAARRLWNDYLERRNRAGAKPNEEYQAILGLIDPMLVEDRQIAVKVLRSPPRGPAADALLTSDVVRRFIRENNILRQLRHPNIVRRFGLVQDPALGWCMLLEYVDGETLDEYMRRYPGRRLPLPLAARMARELVSALEHTQEKGVIHRDLKPQNIMVRADDGRVTLMDFGIGKWVDEAETQQLTVPGDRVGTPRYMAPEQVREGAAVSRATDVYQLSTVLFEMVSGRGAYETLEIGSVFASLYDEQAPHPTLLRDLVPDVPPDLECLIEVGRDKDPERRWTIVEFRDKLDRILAEERLTPVPHEDLPKAQLEKSLQALRIRRKETLWEERLAESRLHFAQLQARLDEARDLLVRGSAGEARGILESLRQEVAPLSTRYGPIKEKIGDLAKAIDRYLARQQVTGLLAAVEKDFAEKRFPEAGAELDAIQERLQTLPAQGVPDLFERYRRLSEVYDQGYRPVVDLFNTLRHSVVRSVSERLAELRRAPDAATPEVVTELLKQVSLAENNLATLDRDRIGPAHFDELSRELQVLRQRLEGLPVQA